MKNETFVDTSGFYALLIQKDRYHKPASAILKQSAESAVRFVTTDYVLDETVTLLKARGHAHLLSRFFDTLMKSKACRVEWTDQGRFLKTRDFFLKRLDQKWSFTDCLSFSIMEELGIEQALTTDTHFTEAGFMPLLT